MTELSDELIAQAVQTGDKDQYGVLIDRYQAKMERYVRRFLADPEDVTDMVQEVLVRAYTNLQSYDSSQRFSPWLYRIAHNMCANKLRSYARSPRALFEPDTLWPQLRAAETADEETLRNELQTEMSQSLGALSVAQQSILVLFFYEELSYKEISDVLQIPVTTVGVRLTRAKTALKKQYHKDHQ